MTSAHDEWTEELQSARLYRVLAEVEREPSRSKLFAELASAAERQAGIWAERMRKRGETPPERCEPTLRVKAVERLIRTLGPRRIRPLLAAMKVRGLSVYSRRGGPAAHAMPTSVAEVGARHRSIAGGNLRAAVFGVNDGLVSNASLILGFAGAGGEPRTIVLSGVAGLLAGAFSMAAGEYVSVRSQRELYERQIGLERAELAEYPEEEAEELALIYHARGLPLPSARETARSLLRDPEQALEALAREELGLDPGDLGSPWAAALASFLSFAAGALVPLVPFLLHPSEGSLVPSILCAAAAAFLVGALLSLFTGRSALWSGARMVLIGGAAGLATYFVGGLFGVALNG